MNKVILMGYVGKTPEERNQVVSLRFATNESGYTKADGSVVEDRAEWHNITIFDEKIKSFVMQHVKVGTLLLIEGKIHYSTYTDKQNIERQGVEIIASSISFPYLGKKKEEDDQEVQKP